MKRINEAANDYDLLDEYVEDNWADLDVLCHFTIACSNAYRGREALGTDEDHLAEYISTNWQREYDCSGFADYLIELAGGAEEAVNAIQSLRKRGIKFKHETYNRLNEHTKITLTVSQLKRLVKESGLEERIDQVFSFIDDNQIKEPKQIKDDIRYYLPARCKKDFISLYNSCLVNDVSDADVESYRPGANPCITGDLEIRYKGDKPPKAIMAGPTIGTGPFIDDKWYEPVESGELECDSYIRFCNANVIRPDDDWLYMEPVDTLTHIVIFLDDSSMLNESKKITLTIGQLKRLIKEGVNYGHSQLDRLINNAGRLKASSKHSGRLSDRGLIKADVHVTSRDDTKPTGYETFDIEVKKGTSGLLNPSFTFTVMDGGHIFPTVSGFSDNAGKEILELIMKIRWDTHDTPKEVEVPTELILRNYAEKHVYFLAFVQGDNYMLIPTDDIIPIQKAQELLDNVSGITFGSRDEFISEHPTCIYELKRDNEGRLRGKLKLGR